MSARILLACAAALFALALADHRAMQHSVYSPFVTGRGGIRYWQYGGAAVVADEYVRLTPAAQSKTGRLWNTAKLDHKDWEIELEYRIGGGGRLGADGLALWYAAEPNQDGPVFGSKDLWKGMAVVVDTFDNDAHRDNPAIWVMVNDGTKSYEPDNEGAPLRLGNGCTGLGVRSTNHNSRLRVRYQGGLLTVMSDVQSEGNWQPCLVNAQIELPRGYYIGVSAATGGLSDNHDVYALVTLFLDSPDGEEAKQTPLPPDETPERTPEPAAVPPQEQPKEEQQPPQEQARQQKEVDDLLKRVEMLRERQPHAEQEVPQEEKHVEPEAAKIVPPVPLAAPMPKQVVTDPIPEQHQQPAQQATTQEQAAYIAKLEDEIASLKRLVASFSVETREALKRADEQHSVLTDAVTQLLRASIQAKAAAPSASALEEAVRVAIQQEAAAQRQAIQDVKQTISREVASKVQDTARSTETVAGAVRGQVDTMQKDIQRLHDKIDATADRTLSKIEQKTSWGFWIMMIVFQMFFAGAYVIWRRMRDDVNKKLI